MAVAPEALAREEIDRLLTAAGWAVLGYHGFNPSAARGMALAETPKKRVSAQ